MSNFIVGKYYRVRDSSVDSYELGVGNKYIAVASDVLQLPAGNGWSSSYYGAPEGMYGYLYLNAEFFELAATIVVGGE